MITGSLLHRYFKKDTTSEEDEQILNWLSDENSDFRILEEYMSAQWDGTDQEIKEAADQKLLERFRNDLYPKKTLSGRFRNLSWVRMLSAACIASLILAVSFYFSGVRFGANASENLKGLVYRNDGMEMHKEILPDGTIAWLKPDARVFLPENFSGADLRLVKAEGEIFFDVVHDEKKPFIVQTGNVNTKVLGTAFNIEAYPDESDIRISLVRGKVEVHNDSADYLPEILLPGEMITWNKKDNRILRGSFSQTNSDDWVNGSLIFNDVPLTDALARIGKRFNLEIRYVDHVNPNQVKITTTLKSNHLDEMLQIFPFVTPFNYRIINQVLLVSKKDG